MTRLLYSLCGADPDRRFSPHAWKIVMALAHKGLDFAEVPTPFTAIRSIEGGISPTVPVLNDRGHVMRDSFAIALYLEETYPDRPSLFAGEGGKALSRMVEAYSQTTVQAALVRIILKDIHDILAPNDQAYFRKSREEKLGRSLEDIESAHAAELAAFRPKLDPLRHMLKYQPFIGGEDPLFADYILFGALQWARVSSPKRIIEDGDPVHAWFERLLDMYDGVGRRMAAA